MKILNQNIYEKRSTGRRSPALIERINYKIKKDGILSILKLGLRIIKRPVYCSYLKLFRKNKKFLLGTKNYNYLNSWKFHSFENERNIEIPIVLELVKKYKNEQILEVGNVLNQFYNFNHDIIDKYEIGEGIINQDIVDFYPNKKYDLIISVSTFEHIGYDEDIKEKNKPQKAYNHCKNLLNRGGEMLITVPLGYNKYIDNLLKKDKMFFQKKYFMERVGGLFARSWREIPKKEVYNNLRYKKIPFIKKIFIGIFRK